VAFTGGAKWSSWLGSIRIEESVVLQAFPVFGLACARPVLGPAVLVSSAVLLAALFLLFAYIFALNDWADAEQDQRDPRKAAITSRRQRLPPRLLQRLALILAIGGAALFAVLPVRTWPYVAWFLIAGALYSHPRIALKRSRLGSSVLHLLTGSSHFLVGYALIRPPGGAALLVSLWCGVVFAAGHLVQEVEDSDADRAAGISTHAVHWGKRGAFLAAFAVFTLSFAYLAGLAALTVLPARLGAAVLFYPILGVLFLLALRRDLAPDAVFALRRRYRLLFGGLMIALVVGVWR
jgi:4-hydroxybenzoate polyprenyltransferase